MKDKVVMVTGANGGLGVSVTQAFLNLGATVVGVSRKIDTQAFSNPRFVALAADIANAAGAEAAVASVLTRWGRIDVLAHTVGGFAGGQSVADTSDETLHHMFSINFESAFFLFRAAIPSLRKTQGRLIAISSRAAIDPGPGVGAYSASKAALVSLVRTIAAENKDAGMTANVLLPGTMDTPANRKSMPEADFSQWVQPGAVASLVAWLASDAGKDVTGAVLPVYGRDG
jgi:NAD(P)-dependent dehydrogenase (short-subunit alcohol dehydrogenase family)